VSKSIRYKVIRAELEHKEVVLSLLDEFQVVCAKIIEPERPFVSKPAAVLEPSFEKTIKAPNFAVFLAMTGDRFVGIVTVCNIPQMRRGVYCAEIEEMYVIPEFQGKGVAMDLVAAAEEWAKENGGKTLRLESSNELKRAHRFYEKAGFKYYGRAYEKNLA